ncbi:hypothetical protein ABIB27_001384 [Arthrobacter sp. UYEF21]
MAIVNIRILLGAAAAAAASLAGWVSLHIAKTLVTPPGRHRERIRIVDSGDGTVTLRADRDTLAAGVFSLFWGQHSGHARIGQVLFSDTKTGTVTRRVEAIFAGQLAPDTSGYVSGYVYPGPAAAGLPFDDITLPGPAPAWFVPGADPGSWVIHIHGLGGRRATGLRTAPFFHRHGFTHLQTPACESHQSCFAAGILDRLPRAGEFNLLHAVRQQESDLLACDVVF